MALQQRSQSRLDASAAIDRQEAAFKESVLRAGSFRPVLLQVRDNRELLWDGEPVEWLHHAMDASTRIPPDGPLGQRLIARWPQLHTGPKTDADDWWVPRYLQGVKIGSLRFHCCPVCQTWFIGKSRAVCCSDGCRKQHRRQKNTATVQRLRERRRDDRWQNCAQCSTEFTPKRSTARFCSTACRVAAHRARSADYPDPAGL
jgi:hypothetical protein